MTPAYAQHRLALQTLQSRQPTERWILKTPEPPLAPRGPARRLSRRPDHLDPPGPGTGHHLAGQPGQRRAAPPDLAHRPSADGRRVEAQVRLRPGLGRGVRREIGAEGGASTSTTTSLMADPVETVRDLYQHFGSEVSDLHARRMEAFLEHRPKDAFGHHRYDPADFGWTYPRAGRGVPRLHRALPRSHPRASCSDLRHLDTRSLRHVAGWRKGGQ